MVIALTSVRFDSLAGAPAVRPYRRSATRLPDIEDRARQTGSRASLSHWPPATVADSYRYGCVATNRARWHASRLPYRGFLG